MGIWNDELDHTWLEELVYQSSVLGKKSNSGYKKEAWVAVLKKLNEAHKTALKMSQLKSRHDMMKGMYAAVSKIVNSSGMGWEAETCRVQCRTTTWEQFLQGKPKSFGAWRTKRFPQFTLCERLFQGTLATGQYALESSAPLAQAPSESSGSEDNESENNLAGNIDFDMAEEEENAHESRQETRRSSASTDSRPPKRQRSSLASKLSGDFSAVSALASKEFELLAESLRPSLPHGAQVEESPHEKAINVLQRDFGDKMDIEDMVIAAEVMENATRASMFLCMQGELREAWLARQVEIQRRAATNQLI
ncbi:hypothetical protein DYB37_006785 [Aphanomyces astaci]|uniref:Myb/SANT-like domain-containing protein n=1 Tax=Aphanomyces astaci TaxID=112090 RepID=A0A3R6XGY2_APHAT|nr:hypothetical protein DYB35_006895 [Aphanomyces astaci]RHZ24082.1 hypothetical protein DYB37_006785 [Aphanomyces astaci]